MRAAGQSAIVQGSDASAKRFRRNVFAAIKASPPLLIGVVAFVALLVILGTEIYLTANSNYKNLGSSSGNMTGGGGGGPFGWEAALILLTNLIISYAAGCATSKDDYVRAVKTRTAPVICVLTQFGLRPLFAFGVCKMLEVPNREAIGIILCSMAPGGNGSNLFELLFGGDIELGIVCTVTSTVFAVGGIPLNFYLWIRAFESVQFEMPWAEIFMTLSTVVMGAVLGSSTRHFSEKIGQKAEEIFVSIGGLLLVIAVVFAVAKDFNVLLTISWKTWVGSVLITPFSFLCGYVPARMMGLTVRQARTVSIEIGECNIGIAYAMNLLVWSDENARAAVFQGVISYTVFNGVFLCILTSFWVKEALEQDLVHPPPFFPEFACKLLPQPKPGAGKGEAEEGGGGTQPPSPEVSPSSAEADGGNEKEQSMEEGAAALELDGVNVDVEDPVPERTAES